MNSIVLSNVDLSGTGLPLKLEILDSTFSVNIPFYRSFFIIQGNVQVLVSGTSIYLCVGATAGAAF